MELKCLSFISPKPSKLRAQASAVLWQMGIISVGLDGNCDL